MIQTLDNYGYEESVYMKPREQYHVTISSEDHIITVEDDGDLLARLGLELVDSTLYLKGYDNVVIAQTDIPLSTGIKDISYDSKTHVITFLIIKVDGTVEPYNIDISDLVDLYQSGKGIEIVEDEDGNKTINVKIDEDSKDVLSADEDGLAIDLSNYLTKDDMESISGLVQTEKERAESAEEDLRSLIKAEEERATTKEDALTQNIVDTNANVATCINQLNENIAKIVTDLNSAIFEESQRATNREKALNDDILKCVTKEEADAKYALKSDIQDFNDAIAALQQVDTDQWNAITSNTNEIHDVENSIAALQQVDTDQWNAITNNTNSINEVNNSIVALQQVDTDQWNAITNNTNGINEVNNTIVALQQVDTDQWNAITSNTNKIDAVNSSIAALQEVDTNQWNAITTNTNKIDAVNGSIAALQEVDKDQWAVITANTEALNNKVDKEESKGLSTNDFTDADKEKLNDIDTDAIYAAIASGDSALDAKITAVSAATDGKVETSTYESKVAEIEANEARIEALIPSLEGYATEQWVEDKKYIDASALAPYSTTEEMKDICVTENEYTTYKKDLLDDISKTYATKDELTTGLATKVSTTEATEIATEVVDSKLANYSPTTAITKMIEDGVNEGVETAVSSANTYTDGKVISAITEAEAYTDTEIAKTSSAITQNANELHVLSVCNDGDEYDTTKAMSAQGTGVVDETYRLIHKLLLGLDENDLTTLNTKLKELIGK